MDFTKNSMAQTAQYQKMSSDTDEQARTKGFIRLCEMENFFQTFGSQPPSVLQRAMAEEGAYGEAE